MIKIKNIVHWKDIWNWQRRRYLSRTSN